MVKNQTGKTEAMQSACIIISHSQFGASDVCVQYLTKIPRTRVGHEMIDRIANEVRSAELAIIISYPTSASGIIVLLKTIKKYC